MRLLIEVGVEELPAIPFLKEEKNILPKWLKIVEKRNIEANFELFYSPRRITLYSGDFPERTPDAKVEKIGAPKAIALKDGKFSQAALSFAKKCGISENELEFKEIDGKEVLYFSSIEKGVLTKELLGAMVEEFLGALSFGKSMRWGVGEFEFIRPIRSLCIMLDDALIPAQIYGISSEAAFFPHRNFGYEKVKFASIDDYFTQVKKHGIELNPQNRRAKILKEFDEIQARTRLKIEINAELLEEVIAITEAPKALLGKFDEEFLELPNEVIITSMRENQRYFPVFDGENLSNHFIVVSNAISDDDALIIKGNEKVLRARLSDAMFFWENDNSNEFSANSLKNVTFMRELGSVYDKEIREREVARFLGKKYANALKCEYGDNFEADLDRAVMLSKADLTSGMVGEFSELQGIMGSYYAKNRKEHPLVVQAIYEQYLPTGEDSALPSSVFSGIVALSNKIDTLLGFFSIDKIPTGNKDPYALRRAANGVIKIVLDKKLEFNLDEIFSVLAQNYAKFDVSKLKEFVLDRFYSLENANPSVIKAVLKSENCDLNFIANSIKALSEIASSADFSENFDTFKRLANIIKDRREFAKIDEKLFENESESALNSAFDALNLDITNQKEYLQNLFSLKPKIDNFFENVMINVDDEKLKNNRLAVIGQIYNAFLKIADIKEISA